MKENFMNMNVKILIGVLEHKKVKLIQHYIKDYYYQKVKLIKKQY